MIMKDKLHLCVPVVRRYDLLRDLILSLDGSTIYPDTVVVIDNGQKPHAIQVALAPCRCETIVYTPRINLGVAASWNWFLNHVHEERLIVNDDIRFGSESIKQMMMTDKQKKQIVSGTPGNAFSCFFMPDRVWINVGFFDESLSPGYAYFEDCDYEERLITANIPIVQIDCGIYHGQSKTMESFGPLEMVEHHKKFIRAKNNFVTKWGRLPRGME